MVTLIIDLTKCMFNVDIGQLKNIKTSWKGYMSSGPCCSFLPKESSFGGLEEKRYLGVADKSMDKADRPADPSEGSQGFGN